MDPTDVLDRPAERPDAVLRYASHADGVIDVFLPAALGRPDTPRPLIVFVHGGFWRQEFDRMHVRPLANDLVARGFVVAVPEYRRTGGAGGWPQTADDVEAAVRDTRPLLADVAPGWIDPAAPVVLSGHSAGGHLALWSGIRLGPTVVRSVVALAPVSDPRLAARDRLGGGAAQALLGGEPDEVPDLYDAADPFAGLTARSPEESVHPSLTVIQGTDDDVVPVTMGRAIAQRHPLVHYLELDGVDHFAVIDPLSHTWSQHVLPALTS